jgi:hypothetical protein
MSPPKLVQQAETLKNKYNNDGLGKSPLISLSYSPVPVVDRCSFFG